MALTPPTVDDLGLFRGEAFADEEGDYVESILQQATDALWVTTGLDEPPEDPRSLRIMDYALMDYALWLMSQAEHRDEINSPFSGERIGSYSYQKMQAAQRGEETGIYWLDMFFRLLKAPGAQDESAWVSSERVFDPYGMTFAESDAYEEIRLRDPAIGLGWN